MWMVWNVFELVLAKVHEWIELWTSICSRYPVLQQNCDLVNEEVLRMNESCLRSVGRYGSCVQSLLKLLFAGNESWFSFAMFLSFEVREFKLQYRLVQSSQACFSICSW